MELRLKCQKIWRVLTIRDVIEKVGKDVVRFIMLTRKSDVVLDF